MMDTTLMTFEPFTDDDFAPAGEHDVLADFAKDQYWYFLQSITDERPHGDPALRRAWREAADKAGLPA